MLLAVATMPLVEEGCVAKMRSDESGSEVKVLLPVGTFEYAAGVEVTGGAVVGWKVNDGATMADSVVPGTLLD